MPPSPSQTANWFRGKQGWFSEREEKILVNRLLRDDPSKGDMHNRQAVNLSRLWKCLKDYDLWPLYMVGLTNYIPPQPPQNYLALILRSLGFSTFNANLLTIPSQVLFGLNVCTSSPPILCGNVLISGNPLTFRAQSFLSSHGLARNSASEALCPHSPTFGSSPGSSPSSHSAPKPQAGCATPS